MHEVKPQVFLIDDGLLPSEINYKLYTAYRRCYSDKLFDSSQSTQEEIEAFLEKMLKPEHAHESPLEHVSLTFHITCSRATSHQLVRHRIASYSQQSQRYVKMGDLPVIVPPTFMETEQRRHRFVKVMEDLAWDYGCALEAGVPAEDARYLLPNAVATHIVVTMNLRTLRHFFRERCCYRAQWEIRSIANQMLDICKNVCPVVFKDAGPHCLKLRHCPESKTCDNRPWTGEVPANA